MDEKTCRMADCDRPAVTRGLCSTHRQWLASNNPEHKAAAEKSALPPKNGNRWGRRGGIGAGTAKPAHQDLPSVAPDPDGVPPKEWSVFLPGRNLTPNEAIALVHEVMGLLGMDSAHLGGDRLFLNPHSGRTVILRVPIEPTELPELQNAEVRTISSHEFTLPIILELLGVPGNPLCETETLYGVPGSGRQIIVTTTGNVYPTRIVKGDAIGV